MRLLSVLKPAPSDGRSIASLQALRFAAAFLVLLAHLEDRLAGFGQRYGFEVGRLGFSGGFGVEIFFVISGFIMLHIGWGKFGAPGAVGDFISRRVARIVPLYWALTAVQVALTLVLRDAPERTDPLNIVRSLGFIPYLNAAGKHRPVLEQGWTLDFEMAFYLLFAASLVLPRRWGLAAGAVALAAGGLARYAGVRLILLDPLLLLFLAGGALALIRRRLPQPLGFPYALPAAFLVIAMATLVRDPFVHALLAILVVAMVVLCRDVPQSSGLVRLLTAGGDCSYSLYLSHGFVLLAVGIVWRKLFGGALMAAYAVTVVVGSLAVAWLCYALVERPLSVRCGEWLTWLRRPVAGPPRTSDAALGRQADGGG